ncbi:hypothetical protein CCUS01_14934 [Colletotrichum cuscutae]|uniref:Uncharacterized protein n=1 Tax=Colletotrichum cuscutae TaxID=1209917 RepID=A0AAI9VFI5_9PEZI|nr:hypothetical protein CCUS01_14934 [Colletotrichum cuscutae]
MADKRLPHLSPFRSYSRTEESGLAIFRHCTASTVYDTGMIEDNPGDAATCGLVRTVAYRECSASRSFADLTDRIGVGSVTGQWGHHKETTKLNRAAKKQATKGLCSENQVEVLRFGITTVNTIPSTLVCQPYLIGIPQVRHPICATESDMNFPDRRPTPPIPSGTGP